MKKEHILLIVIFLVFIGLGLPDALLGSSWNLVRFDFDVPVGYIGFTTVLAFIFTILATYFSPYLLSKFQTKQIVYVSLVLTGFALIAMSFSNHYFLFIIWAIPLGVGAGAIDFSINHYVALHYKASHMSFLHSFYGVGVLIGPMIMAITLQEEKWRLGYLIVGGLLFFIVIVTLLSSKLWFEETNEHREEHHSNVSLSTILKTKGSLLSIFIFLIYVHIESLFGVLIATYFYLVKDISYSEAALFTFMYYIGLTIGRILSGILTNKIHSNKLILLGSILMVLSTGILLFPFQNIIFYYILICFVGIGSGPIFPNMIHMNDKNFEPNKMSKIMSLQMTFSYISFGVLTPIMGFVFQWTTIEIFPIITLTLSTLLLLTIIRFQSLRLSE